MTCRLALRGSAALTCLLLLQTAALAQTAPLPPPSVQGSTAPAPAPSATWGENTPRPWDVDVLLGLPIELRVQRVLPMGGEHPLVLEAYIADYLTVPMAGGGVRWRCASLCEGNNAVTLAPGVDVGAWQDPFYHAPGWFSSNIRGGPFVSLDFDGMWRHQYSGGCNGEIGFKLGVESLFSSRGWAPLPLVGIFAGLEF